MGLGMQLLLACFIPSDNNAAGNSWDRVSGSSSSSSPWVNAMRNVRIVEAMMNNLGFVYLLLTQWRKRVKCKVPNAVDWYISKDDFGTFLIRLSCVILRPEFRKFGSAICLIVAGLAVYIHCVYYQVGVVSGIFTKDNSFRITFVNTQ